MTFQRWALEMKVFRVDKKSQKVMKLPFPCVHKRKERLFCCKLFQRLIYQSLIRCLLETFHQNNSLFFSPVRWRLCVTITIISVSWSHDITLNLKVKYNLEIVPVFCENNLPKVISNQLSYLVIWHSGNDAIISLF